MHRSRRLLALAVILALSASAPARQMGGCAVCPVDCPMHARGAARGRHLGCHGAPGSHSGHVCVRSACGHDAEATASVTLLAIVPTVRTAAAAPRIARLQTAHVRVASAFPPEPPIEPPRALRG